MDNVWWVKVSDEAESWHIVDTEFVSRGGITMAYTLCGLTSSEATVDNRPGHEKTCESCLRHASPD